MKLHRRQAFQSGEVVIVLGREVLDLAFDPPFRRTH
jgi:hypothetical protein